MARAVLYLGQPICPDVAMTTSLERLSLVAAVLIAALAIAKPQPIARLVEAEQGLDLVIGLCFRFAVHS